MLKMVDVRTWTQMTKLWEGYHYVKRQRPPQSEEAFLRWVLEKASVEKPGAAPVQAVPPERPKVSAAVHLLAERFVLMAKAEALTALGEQDAGIWLVENWMRSQPVWEVTGP